MRLITNFGHPIKSNQNAGHKISGTLKDDKKLLRRKLSLLGIKACEMSIIYGKRFSMTTGINENNNVIVKIGWKWENQRLNFVLENN